MASSEDCAAARAPDEVPAPLRGFAQDRQMVVKELFSAWQLLQIQPDIATSDSAVVEYPPSLANLLEFRIGCRSGRAEAGNQRKRSYRNMRPVYSEIARLSSHLAARQGDF
jgi:hypothetical protein